MAATNWLIILFIRQFSLNMPQALHCARCWGYIKPCLPGAYSLVEETEKTHRSEQLTISVWKMTVDKGGRELEKGAGVGVQILGQNKTQEESICAMLEGGGERVGQSCGGNSIPGEGMPLPGSVESSKLGRLWSILGTGRRPV